MKNYSTWPKNIGKYQIIDILGSGGMGLVYRAKDPITDNLVAIKTVKVPSSARLASLRREILALSNVRHPGIIRILNEGLHRGVPWYAMELLHGQTLRFYLQHLLWPDQIEKSLKILRDSELFLPESISIEKILFSDESISNSNDHSFQLFLNFLLTVMHQVCVALAYLHGEGIVHLDLKPENIFITLTGHPVIMDFGLMTRFVGKMGREFLELGSPGFGTLEYMAPELLKGKLVDARADLYSVGCILYEIITGALPYANTNPHDMILQHRKENYPTPSQMNPALSLDFEKLIKSLLCTNPINRIGFAEDIAGKLQDFGMNAIQTDDLPEHRSYLYRTRFIGRKSIIAKLDATLAQMMANVGDCIFINGETGIGKTRLIIEFGRYARKNNFFVLTGECTPMDIRYTDSLQQNRGIWLEGFSKPLQMIGDFCREKGEKMSREIFSGSIQWLIDYEPSLEDLPGMKIETTKEKMNPEDALYRLYYSITQVFVQFSKLQRVIIIIDDLQWADELTAGLISYMVKNQIFQNHPLLLISTYRPEDTSDYIEKIISNSSLKTIRLHRFNGNEIGTMVMDMLALNKRPERFCTFLTRQSEGNPFFVAEYLKSAVDRCLLTRNNDGRWQILDAGEINSSDYEKLPLPYNIHEILVERINSFPNMVRRILEIFSVIGKEENVDLVMRISGIREKTFNLGLQHLISRMVVEETSSGTIRFVHDKMREIVYTQMDKSTCKNCHLTVASKLMHYHRFDKSERFAEIGFHFEKGGNFSEARKYYLTAGRRALARIAFDDGETSFKRYLNLITTPNHESVSVRIEMALDILLFRDKLDDAEKELIIARDQAINIGYLKAVADATLGIARIRAMQNDLETSREMANQALEYYQSLDHQDSEGVVFHHLGHLEIRKGRRIEANQFWQRACEKFECVGNSILLGRVIRDLAGNLHSIGHGDHAQEQLQKALSMHQKNNDMIGEGITLTYLAENALETDSLEKAYQYLEKSHSICRRLGHRRGEGDVYRLFSYYYERKNDLFQAESNILKSMDIYKEINADRNLNLAKVQLASIRLKNGELDEALRVFGQAAKVFKDIGDKESYAQTIRNIAIIARWKKKSYRYIDNLLYRAEQIFRKLGNSKEIVLCLVQRSFTALAFKRDINEFYDDTMRLVWKAKLRNDRICMHELNRLNRAIETINQNKHVIYGDNREDIPPKVIEFLEG